MLLRACPRSCLPGTALYAAAIASTRPAVFARIILGPRRATETHCFDSGGGGLHCAGSARARRVSSPHTHILQFHTRFLARLCPARRCCATCVKPCRNVSGTSSEAQTSRPGSQSSPHPRRCAQPALALGRQHPSLPRIQFAFAGRPRCLCHYLACCPGAAASTQLVTECAMGTCVCVQFTKI